MKFETSENLPKYFKTIQKNAPLTIGEERELVVAIQEGDAKAVEKLVSANLKFVVKMANRHLGQGVPIDDLIQEGNIGLLEAATKFKPREGQRFINYAQLWIRKKLNEAVAKTGRIVRLPHNQEYEIYKSKTKIKKTDADKEKDKKVEMIEIPSRVQIDAPIGDEGGNTIGDIVLKTGSEVEFNIELEGIKFKVKKALSCLKDRDKGIIMDYFGIDREYEMPTDIIAEKYEMTNVRVSQIVKASIQKMKLEIL
jgi:RNA polymerase primary sigma factor